ncbi:MAG: phosphoribosylformylglycinamidine synthase subunit PurS [Aquificota bacterium]|jgi:phosphoribosylformylglycinamidine synthase|uniref:Phosphoribosylformylglycinamidine synthase subunit PurS n=1 Tax=Hydrogenobacter sp. TaxID=2152829 RepID=A0A7C2V2Q9_9AQUI|nr:phosphoribosylformylglycinamidine synthase subunit PurS [Aquificaceae bacterium]MDM7267160.1 phosphoribosylformylglycinamidine synthase subunit PurS [Aquificaceae bacterium]QWK13467.1 MAG: phosphoribosylformylglycinamidine synthase subunit PurS [Aquificota bacterium]HAV39816.1 phosphoribosylformylglycinamidine synthase, purS protein [Aquificaceae bacterium]HCO39740.1 phosphoribosylformylglycinamidine synthase, purS protein [Aquificaceae bacterium]
MRVRVLILPKKGLLDPEGRAVKEMLLDEGFPVKEVKVGKVVELELEKETDIKTMVEKYLINPLVEEYIVE